MKLTSGELVTLIVFCVVLPALVAGLLLVLAPRSELAGGRQEREYAQAGLTAVGITQWLALSLLAPVWARRRGTGRTFGLVAVFVVVGLLTCLAFPAGRLLGRKTLALHAYLAGYGVFVTGLAGVVAHATRCGWAGQLAAGVCAAVFAGNVLLASYILDISPAVRRVTIAATLTTSPIAASGGVLGYDVMRKGIMYESSKISYYNYAYPPWYATTCAHLCAGLVLAAGAWGFERRDKEGVDA